MKCPWMRRFTASGSRTFSYHVGGVVVGHQVQLGPIAGIRVNAGDLAKEHHELPMTLPRVAACGGLPNGMFVARSLSRRTRNLRRRLRAIN